MLLFASIAGAQDVNGVLIANGKSAALKFAVAQEVDSATEKGYMDIIVALSDRKLGANEIHDVQRLETLARRDGLVALVVRLNPDAKVMSTAYDEKRVAGRFWTEGTHNEFRQQWSYDVTFSAPIALDPAAKTVPKK